MNERGHLAAILSAFDDDGPRLVYADSLLEQNDPRGEFIRLQCMLARMPATNPRRRHLESLAANLLDTHHAAWAPLGLAWQFERGFPHALQLSVTDLQHHAEPLARVPWLRDLEVRFNGATLADVAGVLELDVLRVPRALRLNWHTPHALARELFFRPWVAQLETLQLSWVMLPREVWAALGRDDSPARHVPNLDLLLADARDEWLELLATKPWPALRWLRLANGRLGTRGCELLAQPGLFPNLVHLDVSWNRIGKRGAAFLARAPLLQTLEHLDLSHCQIGDDGCRALAEARPPHLRFLSVAESRVSAAGLEALRAALPSGAHVVG